MKLLNLLREIKVLSPGPFRFKITKKLGEGDEYFGNLYFNDTIIAKEAILDQNKKTIEIVITLKAYEKIKDLLPTHTTTTPYRGTQYAKITNISSINIVDGVKEIKVMAPSPFTFKVTGRLEVSNGYHGGFYFNNTLLDDNAIFYDEGIIATDIPIEIYNDIEDQIPSHKITSGRMENLFFIQIDDVSNVRIVNNIKEIKVVPPSPFRFEVEKSNFGRLYFNNQLLDGLAMISSGQDYIEFLIPKETYEEIKDQLPKHDILISNAFYNDVIVSDISKINIIDEKGLLKEIKIVSPGLINTLKNYKSQIGSSEGLQRKIELALQCAKLVLPIFEKLVPNDKVPREAIESIQAYLQNPTIADRMSLKKIDLKSPGYPDAAKLVHNVISMVLGAIIVRDDELPFTLSAATYAIMAAEKDQDSNLNEIKVNPPPVLRFEINRESKRTRRNEFFGNLYLYGELLDDMAFLSLSKALVTSMPKEVYDRVKDQFPPYEVLDVLGTGQIEILFDDTKEIQIIDKRGSIMMRRLNEIKVLSPSPFRVEVYLHDDEDEEDYTAESYFNDILLDDDTIVNTTDGTIVVDILSETYDTIKNLLPTHQVLANTLSAVPLTRIRIEGLKNINIVYKEGQLQEIKVLSPSPFRVEVESNDQESEGYYIAKSYFNDTLLDEDTVVNEEEDYIYLHVPMKIYNTIKDQLPPHKSNKGYSGGTNIAAVTIKDLNNINMIYKEGQLQEIKVLPPSPFRFEVRKKRNSLMRGKLYFNDILLDNDSFIYTSDNSIVASIPTEIYNTIKDQLPPHEVSGNPNHLFLADQIIEITDISNIRIVDNIKEIKVLPPSPFKFEITRKGDQLQEGKLYFNDTLLDDDALFSEVNGFIAAHIPSEIYNNIENILPIHDMLSIYRGSHGITINDISNIRIVNNLSEIRVNTPGLLGTLETYQRQMSSTEDKEIRKQLALKCAELVLPIFEKQFPNDKRPRKAIEAVKVYLLNPTDKNRLTVEKAAEKSEDASYAPGIESGAYSAVALAVYWAADTHIGFDYAAGHAAEYAIRAAELDAGIPIDEIKINKPNSTLRFEAATNTSSDSAHISGTLYLGNKRLDDKVIWFKPGKRMHVTLPLETYYSVKDQLPSYEEVYEYTSSVHKGMRVIDIYINDISNVEIVNDEESLDEIKVVPPVGPGKLKVEGPYMNFGGWAGYIRSQHNPGLPIKDKFVDVLTDYIKVYFSETDGADFESNFDAFTNYLKRKDIKFTSNKLTHHSNGEEYYLVKIPKSQIELVNRQGLVTEIKIVAPGIVSTLENYHSKIRATQDDNTKKELVLRCAELVLPIFEKHYPNDDRLRKAIEAAKAYLLDPTEENKETLRVAKSGASSANVAAYHNGYDDNHAAVVASAAICLSADTIYNYLQVAESAANSAIRAAKLDQNIQEIKVVPPQRRIDPDEYKVIYQLLQGDRKPSYLDDEISGIDFNLISKEYFTNPNPLFFEPERYEEIAEYLDKNNMLLAFRALPVIELDIPHVHFEENKAKYPKQQYYILKYDNKFYFVDAQGFDYPRYVTYLKNFPL